MSFHSTFIERDLVFRR